MARTENTFHLLSLRILKCILLLTISSFTCAKKLGYIKIRITRFENIFQNFLIIFFSREFPLFQREEGKIQREEKSSYLLSLETMLRSNNNRNFVSSSNIGGRITSKIFSNEHGQHAYITCLEKSERRSMGYYHR